MDERKPKAIGERLRQLREAQPGGMTQADFARSVGLSFNRYNNYETGVSRPNLDAAQAIADEYQVTLDWIFTGNTSGLTTHVHQQLYHRPIAV